MAKKTSKKFLRRKRIKKHIRKKLSGTTERPRLVVARSIKSIYAQIIDDSRDKTILTVSDLSPAVKKETDKAKTKTDKAKIVGKAVAEAAKKHDISTVVFDRNGYPLHGRIKALADSARENGLKF